MLNKIIGVTANIIAVTVLVLLLRGSFVEANQIVSSSMFPELAKGDMVLVNRASYAICFPFTDFRLLKISTPARGDVVTFLQPDTGELYIKRVAGIGGDEIRYSKNSIIVNGRRYNAGADDKRSSKYTNLIVPKNHLFLVGDNIGASSDSRSFGSVDISRVVGKAEMRYLNLDGFKKSLERFGLIGSL